MNLEYVLSRKTGGANPSKIFEGLSSLDQDALNYRIRQMPYPDFLRTAYWFAVSMVAKSNAGMRCQVCNSGKQIEAHHRTYDTHGREHRNMRDIVVLCAFCHGVFHGHIASEYQPPTPPPQTYPPPPPPVQQPEQEYRIRKKNKFKKGHVVPHDPSEINMPDGDPIILTKELINQCRGAVGGEFTNATLKAFGLTKPLISGWPQRLVGKAMPRAEYRQAVEGRYRYGTGPLARRDPVPAMIPF